MLGPRPALAPGGSSMGRGQARVASPTPRLDSPSVRCLQPQGVCVQPGAWVIRMQMIIFITSNKPP